MNKLKTKSILIIRSLLIVAILYFICVGLAFAATPYAGPDAYGYSAYEINSNLRDISVSGTVVPLDSNPADPNDLDDQDDEVRAVSIPFPFDFYGISYTQLYVSSNGFIAFTLGADAGCCSGMPLPQRDAWNNLIALFWEDLNRPEGNIRYQTLGTPGNREFVIGFYSVPHHYDRYPVTVEAILHEASGDIELQYGDAPGDGGTHSVGIENANGTIGLEVGFGDVSFSNQGFVITTNARSVLDYRVSKNAVELDGFESIDRFRVKGSFVIDEYSDGIDPINEEVSITIGSETFIFPAGSFVEKRIDNYEFKGVIDGAKVAVLLKQPEYDTLDFVVQASGLDLIIMNNPDDLIITVGDDSFTTQVMF